MGWGLKGFIEFNSPKWDYFSLYLRTQKISVKFDHWPEIIGVLSFWEDCEWAKKWKLFLVLNDRINDQGVIFVYPQNLAPSVCIKIFLYIVSLQIWRQLN